MDKGKGKNRSRAQAGNAIVMLFAAIGMAGVVTYGLNNVIRGPAVTTAEVSRRTIAENNLVATTRLAVASATNQQTNGGDCDRDGFIEPLPYRDAGTGPRPTGGGYIPSNMGASMSDPWGNQYGYCVWDPGTVSVSDAMASCGGATPRRLQGAPRDDQYAIAVISSGKNGAFETQCRDFIDADVDNVPDNIMLETAVGSDDIVLAYTYAEANGIGGGEWKLKDGTPGTAEIGKNVALGSASNPRGAAFGEGLELGGARGLILPRDPGDDTVTGACNDDKANQLRLNIGDGSAIPQLEICYEDAWTVVSGGTDMGGETCGTLGPWTTATAPYGEWHDFKYVNGQFIGVGGGAGNVATSVDGITWTQLTTPSAFWRGVAYGNGTYVAVGDSSAMSSTDGINWTSRTVPENNEWSAVTFGNGIFVAVSANGTNRVMTSPDGIAWTLRTQSEVADWVNVTFLNGEFIASALWSGPNKLMTSPDGINWTSVTNNNNSFGDITYNPDTGIYHSRSGNSFLSSADLQTWTSTAAPAGLSGITRVIYGGGVYAAISWGGDPRSAVSTDGLTWAARPAASADSWLSGAYGNGVFVAGAASGPIMYAECTGSTGGGGVPGSCAGLGSDYYDDPVSGHCYYKNPNPLLVGDAEAACNANGGYLASITSPTENDLIRDNIDGSEALYIGGSDAAAEGAWRYTGGELAGTVFWSGNSSGSPVGGNYNRWHTGEPNTNSATEDCVATFQPGYGNANAEWVDFPCDTPIASLCEVGGSDGSSSLITPHPLDAGMIAHWKMDEGTGTTVADSIGDYDGEFVNTPQWATSGPVGASSLLFQKADEDGVIVQGLLGEPENGTISTWVNLASNDTNGAAFVSLGDNVILFQGESFGGVMLSLHLGGGTWDHVETDARIEGSGWHHLAATWDQTQEMYRVYIDGVLAGQRDDITNPIDWTQASNTFIGIHANGGDYLDMDGSIDDVRIYSRALGPLEVQQLYERSLGRSDVTKPAANATLATNQDIISTGSGDHVCVIKSDGSTWCWGRTAWGQLGIGTTTTNSAEVPYTVKQQSIHHFKQISTGGTHSCGITSDNNAWCWGNDFFGQLGNGTASIANLPVPSLVSGGSVWSEVSTGLLFSCGIRLNGVAYCWGRGNFGQIGNGASSDQASPVTVSGGGLYSQIDLGEEHACGVRTDGAGYCWGRGNFGQIGNGTNSNQNAPTAVTGNIKWKDISAGHDTTCGVSTKGGLFCWGAQVLGNTNFLSPYQIFADQTWEDVEVGAYHKCATKADGTLWCWGYDDDGELGDGAIVTDPQISPVRVNLPGPVMAFSTGVYRTCAVDVNEAVWCWGSDSQGALGNGATLTDSQHSPSRVAGFPVISPWVWGSSANAFQLNGSMAIGLGDKWLSDDGTAKYFGFESAGKARLRQTGTSNQLLIETAAATNSAQVSFKKGTPAVAPVDYTTNRVAEWLFNETTGTTAASSVGAFPGTLSGTTTWNPTGGRTPTNGVLEFDGVSGRVSVANNATLRPAAGFTLRLWVRPDGVQNAGATILSKSYNNGAYHSYALRVTADQKVEFVTTNASLVSHSQVSSGVLRPNAWTLVEAAFIAFGGGNFVKYVSLNADDDAALGSSVTAIAYSTDATGNLFFGSGGCVSTCNPFRGAIDDLRIYSGGYISSFGIDMYNLQTSSVVPKTIGIDHGTNNLEIGTQNATATNWISAITPDLALTSTGNMGLGAATPATKVDVSGSVRVGYESSCTAGAAGALRYTANIADENRYTCPASSWTLRDASSAGQWSDIVYANELFVAVAQFNGTNGVMTSPDGITWTNRTTPSQNWSSITYGNGVFVATTYDSYANVITSTDGITWTPRSIPATSWETVDFVNGRFIAVKGGAAGAIMTSTDGIAWTLGNLPSNYAWRGVTYGKGLYLITSSANITAYSTDAVNWTLGNAGAGPLMDLAFGNGVFVALRNATSMTYSYDGINWTATSASGLGEIGHVDFSNGQFVAVSSSTGTRHIGVSRDGINWTTYVAPQTNSWRGIAYGNGRYVAVAETGSNRVMTSDCGVSQGSSGAPIPSGAIGYWKFDELSGTTAADSAGSNPGTLNGNATFGAGRKGNALVLDGSGDFANMGSAASLDNLAATSACAWVSGPASQPGTYQGIINKTDGSGANGYSLYVGDHRGTTSLEFGSTTRNNGYREEADLVPPNTWTHICSTWNGTNPTSALKIYVNGVEINTGLDYDFAGSGSNSDASYNFVVGGTAGSYFQGMIDEVVLYNRVLSASEIAQIMSATGSSVSGGGATDLLYNCTGQNWTVQNPISVTSSLTFGNGVFAAAGGYPDVLATSPDGITWTARTPPGGRGWFTDITYGNGQFVAVSNSGPGRVITSPDGATWTARTAVALNSWSAITYGNGLFVAVSTDGTNRVMTSPDGVTWTARTAPSRAWDDIAYGNGVFLAISGADDRRMTSPDGITWTEQAGTNGNGRVSFGGGLFLISSSDLIQTTPDGVTLTNRTVPQGNWYGMVYHENSALWVAVAYNGTNRIATSPDGITWTARPSPSTSNFNHVAYGNGVFVTTAGDGAVMTSSCTPVPKYQYCNGSTWNDFVAPESFSWKRGSANLSGGYDWSDGGRTCGITSSGVAKCWGLNPSGELGDSTTTTRSMPVSVYPDTGSTPWTDWVQISANSIGHTCGIRGNGTAWCWGSQSHGRLGNGVNAYGTQVSRPSQVQTNTGPGGWNDWIQIETLVEGTCGLRANGTVWCWGLNARGTLGTNAVSIGNEAPRPVQVQTDAGAAGWSDWVQISGGYDNICGLRVNGTAWCWGYQENGKVGNGVTSATPRTTPAQVLNDSGGAGWNDWMQIKAGHGHACGIRSNGTAWCWGDPSAAGASASWPPPSTTYPTQVLNSSGGAGWNDWVNLTAGGNTCGIRSNGTAWCWGGNVHGTIGNNTTNFAFAPTQVLNSSGGAGWSDWVSINSRGAPGGGHGTCGVRSDGTGWCWGWASTGQLGNGATSGDFLVPTLIGN